MQTRTIVAIVAAISAVELCSQFLAWGLTNRDSHEGPLISTNKGLIRGLRADDGDYYKFLGIPYAVVDEENPFAPSTPHPGFDDVYDAYEIATPCPQISRGNWLGEIQCLELDIYVPNSASTENPLAVMIWIHGGAWVSGSTTGQGSRSQFLLKHDVIVVALNYRLGVYGFICADDPLLPGNQGLRDQNHALRWIKENIDAFGGDVNRITLFGTSAGGMSVNLHLFSQEEKIFQRAIIQSGSALSYWLMVQSEPTVPFLLTQYFNYNATDVRDALSFLSSLDPSQVVHAGHDLNISRGNAPRVTKPCIEKTFDGVQSFMTEHPMNIRGAPKVATTEILIGYNNMELGSMLIEDATFFQNYSFTEEFHMGFDADENLDEALTTIKHFYIGDEDISIDVNHKIEEYATDIILAHSTQRMIQQFLRDGSPAVYSYVFSHSGERNSMSSSYNWNVSGAIHADELGYLFDQAMFQDPPNAVDQLVIDRMTTLWTNFAKYGDPTPTVTDLLPFKWTPVTNTAKPHLDLNAEFTLQGRPTHGRMAFWDLFYKSYARYQMWYKD